MAGVKGRSGTNKGKDKIWAEALRMAVLEDGDDGKKKLRVLAEKCVSLAIGGDVQAMKEIGDRLDGKPAQEAALTIEDRRFVARVPDKAKTTQAWQAQHEQPTQH